MPPSAFFIGGVLRAGGRGGCGTARSALPSLSGAFGAQAKSRELAFASDSPAFYAALASVALSETVGGLPPAVPLPSATHPGGFLFSSWFIATAVLSRWAEGFRHRYFMRKSFASGCKVLSCEGTEVPLAL